MPQAETKEKRKDAQRIARRIARAGLCSRRDAEAWIAQGRVKVDGKALRSPALDVTPSQEIEVDGKPLPRDEPTKLWLHHKPAGVIVTRRDPQGRASIFDALGDDMPRTISVGRLDLSSEGLILLTNDGGLARTLERPQTGWARRYRVRAHGGIGQEALDRLREGFAVDDVLYAPIEASIDRKQGSNLWLSVTLREGRNREVRKVFEALGLRVNRLIRVSYGPFQLGDLRAGEVRSVPPRVLRGQLGPRLIRESGARIESPCGAAEKPGKSSKPTRSERPTKRGKPPKPSPSRKPKRERERSEARAQRKASPAGGAGAIKRKRNRAQPRARAEARR